MTRLGKRLCQRVAHASIRRAHRPGRCTSAGRERKRNVPVWLKQAAATASAGLCGGAVRVRQRYPDHALVGCRGAMCALALAGVGQAVQALLLNFGCPAAWVGRRHLHRHQDQQDGAQHPARSVRRCHGRCAGAARWASVLRDCCPRLAVVTAAVMWATRKVDPARPGSLLEVGWLGLVREETENGLSLAEARQ